MTLKDRRRPHERVDKPKPPEGVEGRELVDKQPLRLGDAEVAALSGKLASGKPLERAYSASKLGETARASIPKPSVDTDAFGEITLKPAVDLSESFRSLADATVHENTLVRAEAVWAIGEYRSERGVEILDKVLRSDPDAMVRESAVYGLGRIGTGRIISSLRVAVKDEDPGVRAAAVDVLGNLMRPIIEVRPAVDAFGNIIPPDRGIDEECLDNGGTALAETARMDEFGRIQLKAALRIRESGNEGAIAKLKEEIKRGGPIKIDLGGIPVGAGSIEVGADYIKVTGVGADDKVSTHAESEMGDVLRDLSKKLGGFVKPEELQEMIEEGALMDVGGKLTKVHSIVSRIVRGWNKRFADSVDLPPTKRKLLCAFTSNVDEICFLRDSTSAQKKIDKAVADAVWEGKQLGKDRQEVVDEIEAIINETDERKLPNEVTTKAQTIGFILRVFNKAGGKQSIQDRKDEQYNPIPATGKALADWIRDTFEPEFKKLGGASAQMSDFLAGVGESNVAVYTQYHSQAQAAAYQRDTKFMRIVGDRPVAHEVDDPQSIVPDSPTKENYPIEVMPSIEVNFNGRKLKARDMQDRVILTTEYYDSQGKAYDFVPLFEFTDDVLEHIGKEYQYFIINGPHYLQRYDKEKYDRIAPQMKHQLETLTNAGLKVHFEFSGKSSTPPKDRDKKPSVIKYLQDVMQGNLVSMGINHTEVTPLVESMKEELDESIVVAPGDDMHSTYLNALQLARYVGLERLYVHGQNMDFTLRKTPKAGDLEGEQKASLHAKQRVTEWLKGEESVYPTPEGRKPMALLKREGFQEMIAFAEQLAEDSGLTGADKLKFMRDAAVDGHAKAADDYKVAFTPVKWIYGETKVTTSSGDITSSTAYIQSPI